MPHMMETQAVPVLKNIRADFPIYKTEPGLVYLDSGATSLKPVSVIEAINAYNSEYSANVHRSFHDLGARATEEYEGARARIARFIHARSETEIVFTSGTTASLNLIAYSWARHNLSRGDVILLSEMEHHSNLIPWQMIAREKDLGLRFIPFNDRGELILDELEALLQGVKLVSLVHVSNVFGTINPVQEIIQRAHQKGIPVAIDGAQSVPHMPIDVQDLDCDFLSFSGHKMMGPSGIGVLYAKAEYLQQMEPWVGGGDMIRAVWLDRAQWNDIPYRFEAGTPNISGAIGLGAAVDYLSSIGMGQIEERVRDLSTYTAETLKGISGIRIFSRAAQHTGVFSFDLEGVHPHDIAQFLNHEGVSIRAGHHCAQPVMRKLGLSALARASLYAYNTMEDVDRLADALNKCREFFK